MRFFVLILFILNKVNASDIGNCTENGRVECCSNFFLKEEKCVECPVGTYGTNCNSSCPSNRFGSKCAQTCNCSKDQICDDKYGCRTPEYYKELYDNCTSGISNTTTKCCTNQRIHGNNCQDCWNGRFGSDCHHKCPPNRYGRFCLNRCNCAANESCHYANGCNINTRKRDLGTEGERDLGTEDDGSLWIKIPGISLGVIIIILIGIFIVIKIKMRTGRKWDNFVQGNPLSSNLHAGASVTTLLSTTSSRKDDKPKVKVSDYPTLKASQDVDKCFDSYHTLRRDETDFHQNRRSIPILFRRSTDRNKLKSSTLPISGLQPNFQGGNTGDFNRNKRPQKHSKEEFRGNGDDTGQHVLHKVESGEQLTCEQNMASKTQDNDSTSNQNAVRYSLVKCV